jgi:hypothetical protein
MRGHRLLTGDALENLLCNYLVDQHPASGSIPGGHPVGYALLETLLSTSFCWIECLQASVRHTLHRAFQGTGLTGHKSPTTAQLAGRPLDHRGTAAHPPPDRIHVPSEVRFP